MGGRLINKNEFKFIYVQFMLFYPQKYYYLSIAFYPEQLLRENPQETAG